MDGFDSIWLQYGAFGLLAYVVFWMTNKLDRSINNLTYAINELRREINNVRKE